MNRETEVLVSRASRLLFGGYGYTDDAEQRLVRYGGSGLFVAPFLGVTAAHVVRDHFHVEPHFKVEDLAVMKTKKYFVPDHSVGLFQVAEPEPGQPPSAAATWLVRRTWESPVTDAALLFVLADDGPATQRQMTLAVRHFEWALLPPPVGAEVVMLGYPQTGIAANSEVMNIQVKYVMQSGRVSAVYERRRDAGMFWFPCFAIDQPVDAGFSGGPVFWDDRFCGIVSGESFGNTYAATLWPLCLLECAYPDLTGQLGQTHQLGTLFDEGVLRARDWKSVKPRLGYHTDEHGKKIALLKTDV
jgi:hypothetical protein